MLDAFDIAVDLKDRGNIANARVAGMQTALNISDYQVRSWIVRWLPIWHIVVLCSVDAHLRVCSYYALSLAGFLLKDLSPYIAVELPSNLLLRVSLFSWLHVTKLIGFQSIGPNIMLPAMVTIWGIICAMQGACDIV